LRRVCAGGCVGTQVETVEAVVVAMVKQLLQTLRIAVLNDIRAIERRLDALERQQSHSSGTRRHTEAVER
jgi:hypothetical protein